MLLDKILFDELAPIGSSLMKKAGLKKAPKNISEMKKFLMQVKSSIENLESDGLLLGNLLFYFVSSLEVRDRLTSSRIFEDLFCALFSLKPTDQSIRSNPKPSIEVQKFDIYNLETDDFVISEDIAMNKREKADVYIGDYSISLKTLKGIAYDENGKKMSIKNNKANKEVNVGSFSYRALLKGLVSEEHLASLGDRKKGFGSASSIRNKMLDEVNKEGKDKQLLDRLSVFMKFIYEDDLYLVLKSNYIITFYLIPANSFVDCITKVYTYEESRFQDIWNRWENNNLRMNWEKILEYCDKYQLLYSKIEINLSIAIHSEAIKKFKDNISEAIHDEIVKLV